MSVRAMLESLASQGHSRTSAHKAAGIAWWTFRQLCAEHADIQWRKKGEHLHPFAAKRLTPQ